MKKDSGAFLGVKKRWKLQGNGEKGILVYCILCPGSFSLFARTQNERGGEKIIKKLQRRESSQLAAKNNNFSPLSFRCSLDNTANTPTPNIKKLQTLFFFFLYDERKIRNGPSVFVRKDSIIAFVLRVEEHGKGRGIEISFYEIRRMGFQSPSRTSLIQLLLQFPPLNARKAPREMPNQLPAIRTNFRLLQSFPPFPFHCDRSINLLRE